MSRLKKWSLVAIIFIIIGGVGCLFTFKSLARQEVAVTKEVSADEVTNLEFELVNEEVTIVPTEKSDISIELKGRSNRPDKEFLEIEQQDGTLIVRKKPEKFRIQFFNRGDSLTLTVRLPQKEFASMQIDSKNGAIYGEQFSVKTLHASAANGKIVLEQVKTDTTEVSTRNGGVELSHVEGRLIGKTSNGSMALLTDKLNQSMELNTKNGSIDINVKEEPTNVTYDLRTDNGGIEVFGNDDWDTVVGDGTHIIKAVTANGSIAIMKQ
ncbi:hypothetical protein J32TS6_19440 [Virgibacillus pantothenticus]|uniref:DUF4097 family beta strand repeat-containing protein n=1 Tax=Virgibacillus TaxID=84406 RepID=UPI00067E2CC1|nr:MULTISPECIES: DUF4097 family beta strand repeat-containing protein [Virgibacillus]API92739.1 hypothetical protein BKP57_13540 [Virgibacillus sp. 6R]MBS7428238.1 DUF4097 family beta strand repeat protein [Virgibacillus sp. 19R1-5]MBU8565328.1 DUF4097 domain-containing protein [Virgibacillus pantothenticus]MBU8599452.1 DUF4097 domain-containing protein [Virgibacillus pantothenticus]MBU8633648.1 DUF4097 domain-containing protein [Virgibacillus pantothenticus]